MSKLLKFFGWTLAGLALLATLDQVLIRVPFDFAAARPAQKFYVDFRTRLVNIFLPNSNNSESQKSIEQVIETNQSALPEKKPKPQRYLYVDETGALQFADSLEQVPARFRDDAQPLSD